MIAVPTPSYRVAVPLSDSGRGLAQAIVAELNALGHTASTFPQEATPGPDAEVILLFGPYGKIIHVPAAYDHLPPSKRPTFVFWNTEGLPDLRLPDPLVDVLAAARSWVGRTDRLPAPLCGLFDTRLIRFRYVGDYLHAYRRGWLNVFADISAVYAARFRRRGLPTAVAHFGSHAPWYADLHLERDIDVLWMGKRATRRRSQYLDRLRAELDRRGIYLHLVDNVTHPFVFDDERTELLNRTKITLNLLRTWYDENSMRLSLAMPNRSLVVSEPLLAHVPAYRPGEHYVVAPLDRMADVIAATLRDDAGRARIVEAAYQVSTQEVTLGGSLAQLMAAAAAYRARLGIDRAPAPLELS
jgi:predicted nucleotidyltransferase